MIICDSSFLFLLEDYPSRQDPPKDALEKPEYVKTLFEREKMRGFYDFFDAFFPVCVTGSIILSFTPVI